MSIIATIFTLIVAIEHVYIAWIEMIAWETTGKKTFRSIPENLFKPTKVLAANQGLYNLFLAAGLFWSFLISNPEWALNIRTFFLGCVIVAGVFGALTATRKIFYIQALPALVALLLSFLF